MFQNKKKLRLLFVPPILGLLIWGGVVVVGKLKEVKLSLPKIISVENYMRIEVKPVKLKPDQWISFQIQLDSTQNKTALGIDLTKVALLVDDKNLAYSAGRWKPLKETEFSRIGLLTFPVSGTPKALKLSIFDFQERVFEWETVK